MKTEKIESYVDDKKPHRCTECDDGWVHYPKIVSEADPENGVCEVIRPALFITKDRKYKVANISTNGVGVCHSCAHRTEKVHSAVNGAKFVWPRDKAHIIVQNLETDEIIIDTVQVDYWHFFSAEPVCDEESAKRILKGGLCEIELPRSRDEVIEGYKKKVEESGMTEDEYLRAIIGSR